MKILITAGRIRSIIAGATTEKEIETALRMHKIRFSYTTAPGFLAIRIPCRTGALLVTRTHGRPRPYMTPAPGYPHPVPRYTWDD